MKIHQYIYQAKTGWNTLSDAVLNLDTLLAFDAHKHFNTGILASYRTDATLHKQIMMITTFREL